MNTLPFSLSYHISSFQILLSGSQLGWLIDPQEQSILIYFPAQQPAFFEDGKAVLPVPDFASSFQLTLGELFGWLLE